MAVGSILSVPVTAVRLAAALTVLALLLAGCGPRGPTTSAFDGVYHGTGYATNTNPVCANGIGLTPMKVSAGHVEFGNVTGWVQPNGQVQMVFGEVRVYGQFQGNHFQGVVYNPQPACNYRLEMDRAG